jgi:uncharacterized SAM-binding protein YcdF (DUF218 family)
VFFLASKIAGFFALPSNLLISIGLVGVVLLATRFTRAGGRIMAVSLIGLAVCGLSPLGHALILPLEERFPAWDASRGAPDGVVVLGGAVDELVTAARGEAALNEAAERMTAAVSLAQRYPHARILFSGGRGRLVYGSDRESDAARRFFADMGVAPGRLLFEEAARNTDENAIFSHKLAAPQPGERWLLVTSAYHMPRAIGLFRRVGFDVEAYPVDWRTRGNEDLTRPFARASEGLRRTDIAVREWMGLVVYRLTGRTVELIPGPRRQR